MTRHNKQGTTTIAPNKNHPLFVTRAALGAFCMMRHNKGCCKSSSPLVAQIRPDSFIPQHTPFRFTFHIYRAITEPGSSAGTLFCTAPPCSHAPPSTSVASLCWLPTESRRGCAATMPKPTPSKLRTHVYSSATFRRAVRSTCFRSACFKVLNRSENVNQYFGVRQVYCSAILRVKVECWGSMVGLRGCYYVTRVSVSVRA